MEPKPPLEQRLKSFFIGKSKDLEDNNLFHTLSLIAVFAWIGLGADALSSSSYGPEEAFLALGSHTFLGLFVALGSALTILIISASYSQLIEVFPSGGGGYLVASKLLSPELGMVSGCALIIDYALTITISIAAGAAAIFSFLPEEWSHYKFLVALVGVVVLIVMNLRGVKESIMMLSPIFLIFVFTHAFVILYTIVVHLYDFPHLAQSTTIDVHTTAAQLGFMGMILLVLHAYSMGAGTFTGIEAVSNGLPILREPRVKTAQRTMKYMAFSLSIVVLGLMTAYLLFDVHATPGKTLNAVLFEGIVQTWNPTLAHIFIFITLFSEAALLFVAAQTGFLDGPRVLANMAIDRWMPSRFANLSDRFVIQNGIFLMGGAALALMIFTHGSVQFLVVLYSITVFITFVLSQTGMVTYWWHSRFKEKNWKKKIVVNGIGLALSVFILISVTLLKFNEGGWITLLFTSSLIGAAVLIKQHYVRINYLQYKYDHLVQKAEESTFLPKAQECGFDAHAKTAVVLVRTYDGIGLHTLKSIVHTFEGVFKNFIFLEIGTIDAGNFKGMEEIEKVKQDIKGQVEHYVDLMHRFGYHAKGFTAIGTDIVDEVSKIAPRIIKDFPEAVFFGGQLVFPKDSFVERFLHNYTVFAVQRRLYKKGITVVLMPVQL